MIKIENTAMTAMDVRDVPVIWDVAKDDGPFDIILKFKDGTTKSYAKDHSPCTSRNDVDLTIGGDLKSYFVDHPEESPVEYRIVKFTK